MVHFLANGLVLAAIVIEFLALRKVRQLVMLLPEGPVRFQWYILTSFIILFILGHGLYLWAFWGTHDTFSDIVVPSVFFLGACFVLLVIGLSLVTSETIRRLAVFEQESITDPLTGIFNRRYLERRLRDEVARTNRYDIPLSVLLIDIDHFKRVNDIYGHQVGDLVLEGMAQLIAATLRTTDVVARYGGEEIMVIAPNTPLNTATELAERLRKVVETASFEIPAELDLDIMALGVMISIGVASFGGDTKTVQDLIQNADKALYRAKSEGRNRVVVNRETETELEAS